MRTIRLCYRKIIDVSSQGAWEKLVFESTWNEFRIQSQLYNPGGKYRSFAEILAQNHAAERLHYLVSTAVTGYLKQLDGRIPGILNNLGKHCLDFKQYRFEIVNSDTENKTKHQVAINFFSEPLLWHDSVGEFILVSAVGAAQTEDGRLTHLIQLQPFLSVYSLKEI
ncbi:MAG: hypothetical protein U0U70_13440 [Chitinophagaceae bacterium]